MDLRAASGREKLGDGLDEACCNAAAYSASETRRLDPDAWTMFHHESLSNDPKGRVGCGYGNIHIFGREGKSYADGTRLRRDACASLLFLQCYLSDMRR